MLYYILYYIYYIVLYIIYYITLYINIYQYMELDMCRNVWFGFGTSFGTGSGSERKTHAVHFIHDDHSFPETKQPFV